MPTFREDIKLGTHVPLIRTDDIADEAITNDKIRHSTITTDRLDPSTVKDLEVTILDTLHSIPDADIEAMFN